MLKRLILAAAIAAACTASLAGCTNGTTSGGTITSNPRLFVANFAGGGTTSNLVAFKFPINTGASPSMTLPGGAAGPNGAQGVAIDGFANLYIANSASNRVIGYRPVTNSGSTPAIAMTNAFMTTPEDLTFDSLGIMYVANFTGGVGSGAIVTYNPPFVSASVPQIIVTSGINGPTGVAFDGFVRIYVANKTAANVVAYSLAGLSHLSTPAFTLTSGLTGPVSVACDSAGVLYVADQAGGAIRVYDTPGPAATPTFSITNGISAPRYVSVDSNGTLYVSNAASVTIYIQPLSAASTPAATLTTGISNPVGLGVGI